jgi:DNA processing protein
VGPCSAAILLASDAVARDDVEQMFGDEGHRMRRAVEEPTGPQPDLDEVSRLETALFLTGGTAPRAADAAAPPAVDLLDHLDRADRDRLRREAEDLADRGVRAVLRGGAGYPAELTAAGGGPRALFHRGPLDVLDGHGLGICGSRNASPGGLRVAALCGTLAARRDMSSVSGYARGVDTATHVAGLEAGGRTVLVLPEGIDHFRVRRDVRAAWDPARAVILSQFAPTRPWTVQGAMARNGTIIGLSTVLVAVEAGETGGTLAAGRRALALGRRVLVPAFAEDTPGSRALLAAGAIAVRDPLDLEELLHDLEHVVDRHHHPPERVRPPGRRQGRVTST